MLSVTSLLSWMVLRYGTCWLFSLSSQKLRPGARTDIENEPRCCQSSFWGQ